MIVERGIMVKRVQCQFYTEFSSISKSYVWFNRYVCINSLFVLWETLGYNLFEFNSMYISCFVFKIAFCICFKYFRRNYSQSKDTRYYSQFECGPSQTK